MNPQWTPFNITLQRFYNCDKPGITIVQHRHTKILGLKDKRQVSSLQSAEWGSLVTFITCMSPNGHFIPPSLLFAKENMKQELKNGTLPGSIHACNPSGWIQGEILSQWFLHFIKHTNPIKEDPVILVLDRHYSDTRNLEVMPPTSQHPQNATLG